MRHHFPVTVGLAAAALAFAAGATAEDGYRHGRVRYVEPGVTLQRATEVSAEEAVANLPFLPGDRVWTDSAGRAEFQFPDGTVTRLDSRSKLDYAGHEEDGEERIVLRLWSGSAIARVRTPYARFEIETPAGMVHALDRSVVRVDVDGGELRLSVYAGEAVLDDGRRQTRLAAGERTYARWGGEAEEPGRFDPSEGDEFARWDDGREEDERWAAGSSGYLPDELDAYAGELDRNGAWRYEASAGYVWVPRVAAGWQPYSHGHWSWTPYGWTWVPYETWGWAPSHYGRWGFSVSFGWYWSPGVTWGPAWVSWGVGGGYVGWCPLGWRNRPVYPWPHHRGYAVPRGVHGRGTGWAFVRQGDLGRRDLGHRRVRADRIDGAAFRVAESPLQRLTRDGQGLRVAQERPSAISRRPTPGDFVRELSVDNRTTIPAPWTRGYGRAPAGAEGARYSARPRAEGAARPAPEATGSRPAEARRSRPTTWVTPSARATSARPEASAAPRAGRERSRPESGAEVRRSPMRRTEPPERRESRPSAWSGSRPREASPSRPSGERAERSRSDGATAYRPRATRGGEASPGDRPRSDRSPGRSGGFQPRSDGATAYRPRATRGGEASPGDRPRGDRSPGRSGGFQPRSEGRSAPPSRSGGNASTARPSNGGGTARSSGGESRGGGGARGGSRGAARPRSNDR